MTPPATPNVFSSKADVAYAELRRLILNGGLPAGSRLAQYELAAQWRMSITPLREAIRRLSGEGLIEIDNHKDARVSAVGANEARQLFEVRLALEPAAVALAAERRTDEDIAVMKDALSHLVPVTRQWGEEGLCAHSAFHRTLYVASHNDVMIKTLDDLWAKSDRYRRLGLMLPAGDEPRIIDFNQHHQMLELVIDRDVAAAQDLAHLHIENSLTASAIDALEDQLITPRSASA